MLYNHLRINKPSPASAWMHFYSTLRTFLWMVLYFLFCYISPRLPTKSFLSIPMISLACTNRCLRCILNIKENLLLNFNLHLKILGFPISLQDWCDFQKEIPQNQGEIGWHICTSVYSDFFTLRFYLTCNNSVVVSLVNRNSPTILFHKCLIMLSC